MTGEDALFFTMLANGTDGGILASAHLATERFVSVHEQAQANDFRNARMTWSRLERFVPLLFREANPMSIKHCLWRKGLISSAECRLPLTKISRELAKELDNLVRGPEETC